MWHYSGVSIGLWAPVAAERPPQHCITHAEGIYSMTQGTDSFAFPRLQAPLSLILYVYMYMCVCVYFNIYIYIYIYIGLLYVCVYIFIFLSPALWRAFCHLSFSLGLSPDTPHGQHTALFPFLDLSVVPPYACCALSAFCPHLRYSTRPAPLRLLSMPHPTITSSWSNVWRKRSTGHYTEELVIK